MDDVASEPRAPKAMCEAQRSGLVLGRGCKREGATPEGFVCTPGRAPGLLAGEARCGPVQTAPKTPRGGASRRARHPSDQLRVYVRVYGDLRSWVGVFRVWATRPTVKPPAILDAKGARGGGILVRLSPAPPNKVRYAGRGRRL